MPKLTARAHEHAPTPERRLVAVGTVRHLGGRTITVRATQAGVTGTITPTGGA
ncbi:hypothetical protein [Streptomyces sp. NBC_01264]|uniref:hypothetical protein n=1 Tax=Streptomyces sp. NBC_01264 TaxID=2903804 RepID=UPI0022563558|nr:hypothetical protein [Streptomyces sp. NBC_01264]MCX4780079.1 hypothetical protein [Streptomyces sp. NBC_01264]